MSIDLKPRIKQELKLQKTVVLLTLTAIIVTATLMILLNSKSENTFASSDSGNNTVAISIPEVAIMDIESAGSKNISLTVNIPSEAGDKIDLSSAKDSSLWLNYSSVRGKQTEASRKIFTRIVSGAVPKGLRLRVTPMSYAGSGDGTFGDVIRQQGKILNKNDKAIINNIGTCYTGDGAGNGHKLVYALEFRNNQYHKINFDQSSTLTVLYTITDN